MTRRPEDPKTRRPEDPMKYIAKTLYGLENVLAGEITSLGGKDVTIGNRAVRFTGNDELMYSVNYASRGAVSVLKEITSFRIRSADDLYQKGLRTEWERWMSVGNTFSITPVVKSDYFNHTGFAGLKLKDAVADYFRKKEGVRPSVDTGNPDVLINLHISSDMVTISLDSSGEPLFKRGYRSESVAAPLNEVLAAGMLMIAGWNGSGNLMDPMCGSGTIPIEAAMIALNIPAGKFRNNYGFQRWKDYDADLFETVRSRFNSLERESAVEIFASDISGRRVDLARQNAENAGLQDYIRFDVSDFRELDPPFESGYIFLNPPYGERLQGDEITQLYSMMGTTFKHRFPGFTAWIITPGQEGLKNMGLKPAAKHTLFNGSIECRFLRYDLYPGSRRSGIPDQIK